MILSLPKAELLDYIRAQTRTFFPDRYDFAGGDVDIAFQIALDRLEHCMCVITHPGFHDAQGNTTFSHLHADQYAQLLYFLGNSLWHQSQNRPLCDKLLLLNRTLFSLFLSYKCAMPEHFLLGHPIGTILGNAVYGDYLVVFQGVTVNTAADEDGAPAPRLGKGLFLGAHAKVIGSLPVGDRVSIGVDAMVYQQAIPDDSVVSAEGPNGNTVRPRRKAQCKAQDYFSVQI